MKKYILFFLVLILLLPSTFALIPESSMKIFAVSGDDGARDAEMTIKIVSGSGKIFSSIDESIVGSSTQESFKNAVLVANKIIGNKVNEKYDFFIDIKSNAHSLDGPSAGGASTLLIISMFKDQDLKNKVSMTGSIASDGSIGDVGGVYHKTKKAAEIGIELFFIPLGNRTQIINVNENIQEIDLIHYAYEEWGLKVIEVSKIDDVLNYAFKDIDSIDINISKKETIDDFIYESINYSKAVEPFKEITYNYIKETEDNLISVKKEMASTNIKDTDVLQNLLSTITYSEDLIDIAKKYYNNNYFYSAANNSFLAYVNVITVNEIVTNPSILANSSIVFDLRIKEIEDLINITENRSQNCSLEYFEWCIGARQRVSWARDKIDKINVESGINNFKKVQDYSYAVAWTEIANSFLDISVTDKEIKFVESNYFKNKAQQNIISVENQMILVAPELANSDDLKRRLDAAKRNYQRGWYVTSLYDSATALSVIKTQEENKDTISINNYNVKYNDIITKLRSQSALNNENNVWSKIFLDHAVYYYNAYNQFKDVDTQKARSQLNVSNSILNFSINLYEVEEIVLDYYFNTDLDKILVDISQSNDVVSILIDPNDKDMGKTSQNVFVYSKESEDKSNLYLYILVGALFLMILAIVIEMERFKKHHSKEGLIKQIGSLDEKLLEGKISPFTYKEMRNKHLLELEKINRKESKVKKKHDIINTSIELERRIVEKQIEELEKRKKELSKNNKSDSIKNVEKMVSKIKTPLKKKIVKKEDLKKKLKVKKNI
jgi:uncharacterized protein